MFLPKSLLIFKIFELKKIRKSYCRVEKASQKVCSGKLKQPSWSVWGEGERGKEMFAILQYFWRRISRTRFPSKFCLFYEIRKLKEEKEEGKKQLLIRPLKMCLLFFKKYFAWESVNFFGIFLQILNLKIWFSTYLALRAAFKNHVNSHGGQITLFCWLKHDQDQGYWEGTQSVCPHNLYKEIEGTPCCSHILGFGFFQQAFLEQCKF